MQPVIRHSFVSFLRNAKPKVSASFQECGDSGTWTIQVHELSRRAVDCGLFSPRSPNILAAKSNASSRRSAILHMYVFYRPPKCSSFLNNFEVTLSNLSLEQEKYILGDFNICTINKSSSLFRSYRSVLNMFNLKQLISNPTRVTNNSSSILDHIICNTQEKICQSGTIPVGISDHCVIFCTRKINNRVGQM